MIFFDKILNFINNIFSKKETVKYIEQKTIKHNFNERDEFMKTLRNNVIEENENIEDKKIETLVCEGDGLGIQKKVNY